MKKVKVKIVDDYQQKEGRRKMMGQFASIVKQALQEDIGRGDVTTNAIIPKKQKITALIKAKECGIIAGLGVAEKIFKTLNKKIIFKKLVKEGNKISKGQTIAEISGNARAILTAERTALNFLQRLSGIATLTKHFIQKTKHAKILDTRKTTPTLRSLEKYAVEVGGGHNHRIGLYDMILIKDNHIASAGSITKAIQLAKQKNCNLKIEVETKNLKEVKEALTCKPNIIMLDNMNNSTMRKAIKLTNKKGVKVEASGNMNLKRIKSVDETGVDFISVGSLTHSAKALDLSMEVVAG